ncbi:ABC transporter ATP-binding protein [Lactobacillus sp. MRS-253-APC-2B]|uniref:ATP-binding cassette domain-containing protein n=1 Tax=Lactobacillus sp. MRS-253-APC-2B TaxID=2725305 RepID=UPI00146C6BD3|nr:ABC transporter ATP-binding protein [Lactobacillus sp. MRS-253-APC-2B]NME33782.1 ABC transporter ATP-binding protein [Lactobacillus sp. MRS-253-APC-2B]
MNQLAIDNLTFAYTPRQTTLKDVTLKIPTDSWTLFYGASGSGKSTLMRLLAGLLPKYGGKILQGKLQLPDGLTVAMMFQDPGMQFALDTPQHELEFALENLQLPSSEMPARIEHALKFCGIEHLCDRQLTTMSSGEQQRAALAVLVAMDTDILLLDEPFASIDNHNRSLLIHQLTLLQEKYHKTIIVADHDLHGYRGLAKQIIHFENQHAQLLDAAASDALLKSADQLAATVHHVKLPTASDQPILTLKNVVIEHGNEKLITANDFSFFKNQTTLLTGATGTGKSSLFKAITHLASYQGIISYDGKDSQKIKPRRYAQQVGYVFQHAVDQFLNVTVKEELALSLKKGQNPYFDDEHLTAALRLLGLSKLQDRVVYSLSGGQQKKLQLLLMLMMGQPVLLLDEPFSGLDFHSLHNVVDLIKTSQKIYPQTMIIISHQLEGLEKLIDRHVKLADGRLSYREEF